MFKGCLIALLGFWIGWHAQAKIKPAVPQCVVMMAQGAVRIEHCLVVQGEDSVSDSLSFR